MKTKYMLNRGLAFDEQKEMKRLEEQAAKGWHLKKFAWGGFFYELVPGPKQDLSYSLDYQLKPSDDYLEIHSAAGWTRVTSTADSMHIFSAPKGTAPIYSDDEVDEGKYTEATSIAGKCAAYSFIALTLCLLALNATKASSSALLYPIAVLSIVVMTAFIFSFLPFVAYKYKARKNR